MAKLLIRADATPEIGTGHVMRCLALVEELQARGHHCRFVMAAWTPAIASRLAQAGVALATLPGPPGSTADRQSLAADAEAADATIIDGYHFDAAYRAELAAACPIILAWDDGGTIPLAATLVVNASSAASAADYATLAPAARLLLGPAFTPLRWEIRRLIGVAPMRRHLLLSFGGSDPLGLTAPVLQALAPLLDGKIEAVLGGSVADPVPALVAATAWPGRVRLHRDTPSMGTLIAGARLAVSAGGGTLAELAALRTPSVLVAVSAQQQAIAELSAGHGWCVALDGRTPDAAQRVAAAALALWNEGERLAQMSAAAQGLIDGGGPARLADALEAAIADGRKS
jgi:UDP-2,4-diacetamido-2,4,6-trideoxy-beta-L-altropyranose hydrolase